MSNQTTNNPTRSDYINWLNDLVGSYGSEYHHYAFSGHFGGSSNEYNKDGYEKRWLNEEREFRRFFSILSRKYTGIKKWGTSSRHREMKVLIVPEIQQSLHLHGILSLPAEMNEFNILAFDHFANKEWKKIYNKGSFLIKEKEPIVRDGIVYTWEEYITKRVGYGDIFANNIALLPFNKSLN